MNNDVMIFPTVVGSRIGPLVLGLEPTTYLQTFDQTSPTFQHVCSALDLLLFGSMMFCLPICLLVQKYINESQ